MPMRMLAPVFAAAVLIGWSSGIVKQFPAKFTA
jgi:hypothetical protein